MNCLFNYNSEIKKLEVSAQTDCKWSCVVTDGNITLNSYYGDLNANEKKEISLFTYGTSDMYGTVICKFEKDDCIIKQHVSIPSTSLHVFNISQPNLYLFGENTKTYLYVYYGTLNTSDRNVLQTLFITIDNETISYEGNYLKYSGVTSDSIYLYDMEILPYNTNGCYFEIIFTSKCEYIFNDKIIIEGKDNNNQTKQLVIDLTQNIVSNAPTLLKISPSFVFLDSKNPKQKITVTSIYKGAPKGYSLSNNIPVTSSTQHQTYSNNVEEYLNSTDITLLKNDDLDIDLITQEKNATHFVLNMSSYNNQQSDNVDNSGDTAYELYVVQDDNPSCYQKLEFFYDYIFDPTNYIEITKIDGIYGYTTNEGVFVSASIISGDAIPQPLTIYFTKDESIQNPKLGYVYAKYSTSANVELTINSVPAWWKIQSLSDYVKEVKQNNKLQIALENTIPSEGTSVSLINEKGYVATIFCKSDSDIFSHNISIFGFKDDTNIVTTQEGVVGDNVMYFSLQSQTEEEKWYHYDTLKEFAISAKTISLPTILYEKNTEDLIVNETLTNYNFEILYNSDIAKYYVVYGSITKKNNKEIELKDNNRYYCNQINDKKLNVIIPLPEKTKFVPWTVTNRGYGILYDIYEKTTSGWVLVNDNVITYKPISENTIIGVSNTFKNTLEDNATIQIVPHNTIPNISITSAIIFQQMNSLKESTLFLTLNTNAGSNPTSYTSLYGDTVSLNNMRATETSIENAINNPFIKDIKEVTKLYYASYYKINSFQTKENDDVSLNIIKEYKLQELIDNRTDLSNENATLYYRELSGMSKQSLSKKWKSISDLNNGGKKITNWEIKDGYLYADINSTLTKEEFFPQDNKEDYIDINGKNKGFIFSNNEINTTNSETRKEKWFKIEYKNIFKIVDDNKLYQKWGDFMEKQCIYPVLNKTFNLGDTTYELDNQNVLAYIDPNDGQIYKYVAYQENNNWYINFNNVIYGITYENNKLIINNNSNWVLNSNNEFIKDGIIYYPRIKVNLKGLILNVLTNIEDEKENFIIINKKKYVANTKIINNELKTIIELSPTVLLEVNTTNGYKYVCFNSDYIIDVIIEQAYKYVVIDNEVCKLTNNDILIYDSKKYAPITQNNTQYIVLDNNKGYKVQSQSSKNYIILNYKKYSYDLSGDTFSVPSFLTKGDEILCEEIANETFQYNLNFDDLLSNDIISGKHNAINVSNGYISINNDIFFTDGIYTVQKERNLDENNYPLQIITNEKINLIAKTALTLNSVTFVDDTYVILSNNESVFYSGNSIISGSQLMGEDIIINDYSEIIFNGSCKLTVKNDCVIQYSGQSYNLLENETLMIDTTLPIIFTDVTKVLIEKIIFNKETSLYVFNDVVIYNNNLYIATTINNKKAITVNNEVYYIYDNKVELPNDEEVICYEKSILYKKITNNGIQSYAFEIFKFTDEDNKPSYGYITNCICENGNKSGGGDIVSLPQKYSVNSYISIFCENVSNNDYVTPLQGSTVILWFEADASLEQTATTYLRVSTNFGLNNPILDFQIPNNDFIVYGRDEHERFYANGNKITYNGIIYDIQKDSNGKFVQIGDKRCKVQKSSSLCYGIEVFLSGDYFRLDKKVRLLLNTSIKQNENFNYFITLPCFNNEKWQIEEKRLSSITIYQRNDFNYSKAVVVGHTNLGNIEIENGKLNFSIDCYKFSGNSVSGFTNKQQNYEFIENNAKYSIWDYYANTYVKKTYLYDMRDTTLNVIKNITLNNIKHQVDQNKYVKIKGKYLPIYELKNYQELECPNGNIKGGANAGHFKTPYTSGTKIQVRCLYKGVENEIYAAPLRDVTLLCWYKEDTNLQETGITYDVITTNFGLNYPITYTLSNGDFILFDPANNKRRRYYVKSDSNGKYVEYNGIKYYISGETSDSKGYTIIPYINKEGQLIEDEKRYVYSSNAECYGLKVFLNTGDDVKKITALSVYTLAEETTYNMDDETKTYGIFYENELYNTDNTLNKITNGTIYKIQEGLLSIPQLNKIEATIDKKIYVLFDIDAYLSFNFNYMVSNEKYGVVRNFLVSNNVSVEHNEYILLKAKENINRNDNQYTYGLYKLKLLPK